MKKAEKEIVESVAANQENLDSLSVDNIKKTAPAAKQKDPQKESLKKRAEIEGAKYIEPKRRMSPPVGKLPDALKKQHAHDWEYVKGIYENYVVTGEPLTFSLCLYPGDPDYMWEIPANTPIYVPRMVAKHLEETQAYHSFGYMEKSSQDWKVNGYTHQFAVTGTHYRGKFRPIGAFS
jgi:hypothetical protein